MTLSISGKEKFPGKLKRNRKNKQTKIKKTCLIPSNYLKDQSKQTINKPNLFIDGIVGRLNSSVTITTEARRHP